MNAFATDEITRKEVLHKDISSKNAVDLTIALVSMCLVYGLDRVEAAIKNTYTKDTSAEIIKTMNLVFMTFA